MGGSSQQVNSRAVNKWPIISSFVFVLPKTCHQPLLVVQPEFLPLFIPPCLPPHISFGSCYFQLLFSSQTSHNRKKSQMPFHYLCYTKRYFLGALCLSLLCVSLLGCCWCQYSWQRWDQVHLLMLPDAAQTRAEKLPMLCRSQAASKGATLLPVDHHLFLPAYMLYKVRRKERPMPEKAKKVVKGKSLGRCLN